MGFHLHDLKITGNLFPQYTFHIFLTLTLGEGGLNGHNCHLISEPPPQG